jgi:15-cis-phytoene synthase
MTSADERILDAAGIGGLSLRDSYQYCRRLHAEYGRTYYAATRLLPPWKRPHIHALYGFARYADEIVDNGPPSTREHDFTRWSRRVVADLDAGSSTDPVCQALIHTMRTWDIAVEYVEAFLESMRSDLTVTEYGTFDDLRRYMYGSAAVIGLETLPILEPVTPAAAPRARAQGEAFQLTNFIRDVTEDLARGRVYLPMEDLERFGVTRADLATGGLTDGIRELLRFEIARTREMYRYAWDGIAMLHPSSRPCVQTAHVLYGGILAAVEKASYQILRRRVRVGRVTRARVGLAAYLRARRTWTPGPAECVPPPTVR